MPRASRGLQVEFEPGASGAVDRLFSDGDGKPVTVDVVVRGCDDVGNRSSTVTKSDGRWTVELPDDAVVDLDGLVGDDGVAVRLTVVSRPCHAPQPSPADVPPPPPDNHADIESDAIQPAVIGVDITAGFGVDVVSDAPDDHDVW